MSNNLKLFFCVATRLRFSSVFLLSVSIFSQKLECKLSDFSQAFVAKIAKNSCPKPSVIMPKKPLGQKIENKVEEEIEQLADVYDLFLKTQYELASSNNELADTLSGFLVDISNEPCCFQARGKALFECGKMEEVARLYGFYGLDTTSDWEFVLMNARAFDAIGIDSKASQILDLALERFPDKEQVVHQKVVSLIKKEKYKEALGVLNGFLDRALVKANNSIFHDMRAIVRLKVDPNDFEGALADLDSSISFNWRNTGTILTKIAILQEIGRKTGRNTREEISSALVLACDSCEEPSMVRAFVKKLTDLGLSGPAYKQLLRVSSDKSFTDQRNLAILAFGSGDIKNALIHAKLALKINKKSEFLLQMIFECFLATDKEKAGRWGFQWFSRAGNKLKPRRALLSLLAKDGADDVFNFFKKQFAENSDDFFSKAALADAYFIKEDFQEAYKILSNLENHLLKFGRPYPAIAILSQVYFNKSLCCLFDSLFQETEILLNKVLQLVPDSWQAHYIFAFLPTIGLAQRLRHAEFAMASQPFFGPVQNLVARLLFLQGKILQSSRVFSMVIAPGQCNPLIKDITIAGPEIVFPGDVF